MNLNAQPTYSRIALYGGSFDPVHCAHLEIARRARAVLQLDQVVFVPAACSPLKATTMVASDAQRVAMLELALREEVGMAVDCYETQKGGMSYSVETVAHFQRTFSGARLYWILGADQFEQLDCWRSIEELAELVEFIVFARPGYSLRRPDIANLRYQVIEAPEMQESSSAIRAAFKAGTQVSDWLEPAVEAFICKNELYR